MTEPKNVQYLEGLPFLRNRYNCNTKIFATLSTSLPNIDRSFPVNTKYLIFEKPMVSLMSNYFHFGLIFACRFLSSPKLAPLSVARVLHLDLFLFSLYIKCLLCAIQHSFFCKYLFIRI
jgi:hypothetical protein